MKITNYTEAIKAIKPTPEEINTIKNCTTPEEMQDFIVLELKKREIPCCLCAPTETFFNYLRRTL
jgi:hypothetical protein